MLRVKQGLSHCRILQKRVNSDKKQSVRTERSINIGKKTIQVSNFHNAAETDVNLTGRKQILIQKSRCLFFDGKTVIIFGKNFKPYKVRFNFSKKRKRFFLLKKILNETRNIADPDFRKRKDLFFVRRNEIIAVLFIRKVFLGRKTAFIQKASNRLTREQNFLIIDWHCYIIITIVTKK